MIFIKDIRWTISNTITMALVAGVSFFLVVYVGYGEANRSYQEFYEEKLTAQGKVIVNAIEGFLKRDLPLRQYVGFSPRASRLLSSDRTVSTIAVFDDRENIIFQSGEKIEKKDFLFNKKNQFIKKNGTKIIKTDNYLIVLLPLHNDDRIDGLFYISMNNNVIANQVKKEFKYLILISIFSSIFFGIFVGLFCEWLYKQKFPYLQIIYAVNFLVISSFVVLVLITLYANGAQIKTKALADSLGQRMIEVVGFNLDIQQIPGLDKAFSEYRRLNPDIAAVSLVVDGKILIHTDSYMVGRQWESSRGNYEYLVNVNDQDDDRQVNIAVVLPHEIVYWRTLRSVKNFAALFVASALLASLFLQLGHSINKNKRDKIKQIPSEEIRSSKEDEIMNVVKSIFYVVICVEHLSYSFLASYIENIVNIENNSTILTSAAFTTYYFCFALMLIPSGFFSQHFGEKLVIIGGISLSTLSYAFLLIPDQIVTIFIGRAVAGFGQALIFIGIQSYILNISSEKRKTQGSAIIVYGFQGGMISGMAIGSLLISHIGPSGIFILSIAVLLFVLFYTIIFIPEIKSEKKFEKQKIKKQASNLGGNILATMRHHKIIQTVILIGVPAKAILTGIIVFALPLLLSQQEYLKEDIGQILMVYAGSVIIANNIISKWVDKTGHTVIVLTMGGILSCFGLYMISYIGWSDLNDIIYSSKIEVMIVTIGVMILGLAHGMINAPIVSHITAFDISKRIGMSSIVANYRFVERLGHVAGPIIVGQLFIFADQEILALVWIGMIIGAMSIIFLVFNYERLGSSYYREQESLFAKDGLIALHIDEKTQIIILSMNRQKFQDRDFSEDYLLHKIYKESEGWNYEDKLLRNRINLKFKTKKIFNNIMEKIEKSFFINKHILVLIHQSEDKEMICLKKLAWCSDGVEIRIIVDGRHLKKYIYDCLAMLDNSTRDVFQEIKKSKTNFQDLMLEILFLDFYNQKVKKGN